MGAGFTLFTVVKSRAFVGWKVNTFFVWACWTIYNSNNIMNWFLLQFKNTNYFPRLQEKRTCFSIKRNIVHLTHGRALRTLMVTSCKRLESVFVHAKRIRTHCSRSIPRSLKFNDAIVIRRMKGESVTHCTGSDLVHTCLQRKNGSCRGGEVRDG